MKTLILKTMSGSRYTILNDNGNVYLTGGVVGQAIEKITVKSEIAVGLQFIASFANGQVIRTSPIASISAV